MTLLESARDGKITTEMEQAAVYDRVSPEEIRERIARGVVVVPRNCLHDFSARGIGAGLSTKINANIGTSASHADFVEEVAKLKIAIDAGADAVMDLSTGGDIDAILAAILAASSVMIGTVPIYRSVSRLFQRGRQTGELTEAMIFEDIEHEAKMGVDFITVHCGITRKTLEVLGGCERIMGIVSRGGSLMAEWMKLHDSENPLYEHFDRLLEIAREYEVTLPSATDYVPAPSTTRRTGHRYPNLSFSASWWSGQERPVSRLWSKVPGMFRSIVSPGI